MLNEIRDSYTRGEPTNTCKKNEARTRYTREKKNESPNAPLEKPAWQGLAPSVICYTIFDYVRLSFPMTYAI